MAEALGCPRPGPRLRRAVLLLVAAAAALLFLWQLGATGLVDETPPLFAAAARAMATTGDWLTPRVNGLPRYDKPPLVYWLMALGYLLPGQASWDPLGTWAARLPSALSSAALMLLLAHTLLRWPQPPARNARQAALLAFTAPLAFALSPLVLLWGRLAVSDALFTALVAASLLLLWRHAAAAAAGSAGRGWWHGWLALGLAVLTKGPAALALVGLPLVLFGWSLGGRPALRQLAAALRPGRGLALAAALALPWYLAELAVEGRPYWDSFFGYHNLQRFTAVVNEHRQPWWYFAVVLVVASLPATPLLLRGLAREARALAPGRAPAWPESLGLLAACWLLAVLLLFTLSATKLPSYWLPATPAAGLLIAAGGLAPGAGRQRGWCWAWG
ncbi:MAG: glycosyltransferase family 39 protein, partial [Prochlorococcaceae cyanobacterium]